MKKKLVVLLAVVMMFAFSASAYAATFSDVSERPVVEQDAIKKAVALGIIEGYEDGTFGPDKTITRAEFAKIAVTAAGAKDTATMLEANASNFKDVKANSWYTGWINASESLGIFKGDTNGNFRPNDTISNQEAITVLLRLLGYNDNLTGSWPVNYVTKANQINILDDVNIVASAAAKRGDITVMLSETLDSDLVTYDKDTNEFVKKQVGITDSQPVTLLADSFEGSYIEVSKFEQITQLRDVADKTLNWGVGQVSEKVSTTVNGVTSTYEKPANYKGTLIVDKDTAVSYNAAGLFDLENHQGKVYYVKGNDGKMYARFIEVESYTQTVTDEPKKAQNGNRVTVNTTNYNATSNVVVPNSDKKNTNFTMYFNDDDQVYLAVSDQSFTERSFYVKSTTNTSARLVGDFAKDKDTDVRGAKTVNMSDADTLIWDGDKFLSPSDLEVGDALREIVEGDLYVKVADANGTFTRFTENNGKVTIDGKNYVIPGVAKSSTKADVPFYDEELETSDATLDDVYTNNVRYILNKNNTVAAIIVDETSTGTTLYGIVVGGDSSSQLWGSGSTNSITLFNQEGYDVTYDFKKDCDYGYIKADGTRENKDVKPDPKTWMGRLVEFKLNSAGEIKQITLIAEETATKNSLYFDEAANKEIEVKNNAYLVDANGKSYTLASNVVIFEVGQDEDDIDPSLVTRSNLLSSGDFTPDTLEDVVLSAKEGKTDLDAYAVFNTNTSGAIKVLAYTTANTSNYHFGVVKAFNFRDSDHTNAITLEGDDTVYDLKVPSKGKADAFIVYTLSGDEITVVYSYEHKGKLEDYTKAVNGFNSGLISLKDGFTGVAKGNANAGKAGYVEDNRIAQGSATTSEVYNIMTDANTVVYIIDATSGKYVEGSLEDISRNSHVAVPVIDKDGYADVVLVDEYTRYGADSNNGGSTTSVDFKTPELLVMGKDGVEIENGHGITLDWRTTSNGLELTPVVPSEFGRYNVSFTLNGVAVTATKNGNVYTIATPTVAGSYTARVTVTER